MKKKIYPKKNNKKPATKREKKEVKKITHVMKVEALRLSRAFPEMGFALLLFKHNVPGVANYVSNSNREDMIKALRETADMLEAKNDIPECKGEA